MGGGRKGRHIGPDLGDNGLDRNSTESWYLVQPVDDIAKGRKRILDSDIERDNAFLQLFDSLQMLCEEETMVFADPARCSRTRPVSALHSAAWPQRSRSLPSAASFCASVSPEISAFKMRRPLGPEISVMTDDSLTFASSRTA